MSVVIYARISEDKTGEAAGVKRQVGACRLLAEAKGWTISRVYDHDSDISAWSGKNRPDFERLVTAIEAGEVDKLLVFHLDRLVRRMSDLTRVIEVGRPRRLEIAAVHGVSLDLGDPTGVAVAQILTAIAEMESGHKGQRQRAANRQRAERGRVGWTRRPFGYNRHVDNPKIHPQPCDCPVRDGSVFVVPDEAAEYRRAVVAVLSGATLASIVADWNTRGIATTVGGPWTVTPLRNLLLNPRHAGRAVSKGKDYGEGGWESIIPWEAHERLGLLLRDPARRTAPSTRTKYLLSGLIVCGKCGERMFATPTVSKGKRRMVYRCFAGYGHLTRLMDPVDEHVTNIVLARLSRPDAADLFAPDADLDALRSRAVDLRNRRDAIASMLADGLISADAGREQAVRLTDELAVVEREIESVSGNGPLAPLAGAQDIRAAWDGLELAAKRAIVDMLYAITLMPQGKGFGFNPDAVRVEPRT